MVEKQDYFDFDDQNLAPPIRKKRVKFHEEDFEPTTRKLKPRQLKTGFGTLATRTLFSQPGSESRSLLNETGFSARALSPRSIELLEVFFRRATTEYQLDEMTLQSWLTGNADPKVHEITTMIEGRLFEEVITREFVQKNPDIFLANPNLTGSIIRPLLMDQSTGEYSVPDHLVFLRRGNHATLAGFMEDKKAIFETDEDELIEQLENQWNLWLLLSRDSEAQSRFRKRVLEAIPTFPHRVNIASESEGKIWLATTSDFGDNNRQLLPWVRLFQSSVSSQSMELLAEHLIKKRFLPRLVNSDG